MAFIADMGLAKNMKYSERDKYISGAKGCRFWMAPEILEELAFQEEKKIIYRDLAKTEVFSLGLIFLYCLDPARCNKNLKSLNNEEEKKNSYLEAFYKDKKLPKEFEEFSSLLSRMLSWNPEIRPSIEALYYWILTEVRRSIKCSTLEKSKDQRF